MKPIPFDPATNMAPIPFDQDHLESARDMKQAGLQWTPHVGCFVWDHEMCIDAVSPFPLRVYFILSLPRFISIFEDLETIVEKFVWLPTWHQARLIAGHLGVDPTDVSDIWSADSPPAPGKELLAIYRLIRNRL